MIKLNCVFSFFLLEILKSLVLPGVGSFTIVDGYKVTQDDLGIK